MYHYVGRYQYKYSITYGNKVSRIFPPMFKEFCRKFLPLRLLILAKVPPPSIIKDPMLENHTNLYKKQNTSRRNATYLAVQTNTRLPRLFPKPLKIDPKFVFWALSCSIFAVVLIIVAIKTFFRNY